MSAGARAATPGLNLLQTGAGAEEARPGKTGQAGDMVAVEMGDDDGTDVPGRETERRQLVGDGIARLKSDRRDPAVEAFRERSGGGEEGRVIAGVEQHRPLVRMLDQGGEGGKDGGSESCVAAGHDGGVRTGPGAQDVDPAAFHGAAANPGATVRAVSTAS
jgi:hypothetical protein